MEYVIFRQASQIPFSPILPRQASKRIFHFRLGHEIWYILVLHDSLFVICQNRHVAFNQLEVSRPKVFKNLLFSHSQLSRDLSQESCVRMPPESQFLRRSQPVSHPNHKRSSSYRFPGVVTPNSQPMYVQEVYSNQ